MGQGLILQVGIKISAIICTYNRSRYICKAIDSLLEQTLDCKEYEILVIDNGSTDETKSLVLKNYSTVTNLHYIFDPKQGLSYARNTGLKNAKGKYLAYLDDDAIASKNWLEKILEVFQSIKPEPGAVGGKIDPIWEISRPSWLCDDLLQYLTILDWSNKAIILEQDKFIAGANMAIPKKILEKVGGFKLNLGRIGNKLLSNEEIVLLGEIKKLGLNIYYDPQILVKHHISKNRITQSYFLSRFYWQGVSDAVTKIDLESLRWKDRLILGTKTIFNYFYKQKYLLKYLLSTNKEFTFMKAQNYYHIGYLLTLFNVSFSSYMENKIISK